MVALIETSQWCLVTTHLWTKDRNHQTSNFHLSSQLTNLQSSPQSWTNTKKLIGTRIEVKSSSTLKLTSKMQPATTISSFSWGKILSLHTWKLKRIRISLSLCSILKAIPWRLEDSCLDLWRTWMSAATTLKLRQTQRTLSNRRNP